GFQLRNIFWSEGDIVGITVLRSWVKIMAYHGNGVVDGVKLLRIAATVGVVIFTQCPKTALCYAERRGIGKEERVKRLAQIVRHRRCRRQRHNGRAIILNLGTPMLEKLHQSIDIERGNNPAFSLGHPLPSPVVNRALE